MKKKETCYSVLFLQFMCLATVHWLNLWFQYYLIYLKGWTTRKDLSFDCWSRILCGQPCTLFASDIKCKWKYRSKPIHLILIVFIIFNNNNNTHNLSYNCLNHSYYSWNGTRLIMNGIAYLYHNIGGSRHQKCVPKLFFPYYGRTFAT